MGRLWKQALSFYMALKNILLSKLKNMAMLEVVYGPIA